MSGATLRTVAWTLLAGLAALGLGGLALIYSGAYDVAATAPHLGVVRWALNTTQERSVAARADGVGEPLPVDPAALRDAFVHYGEMCAVCHGAPGEERGDFGRGMNPRPPRLERVADEWSDREVFWILRNGIKMAGMPAFGATHSDEELWALAAAVRRLPELSEEEYRRLSEAGGGGGEGHSHAGGGHGSEP